MTENIVLRLSFLSFFLFFYSRCWSFEQTLGYVFSIGPRKKYFYFKKQTLVNMRKWLGVYSIGIHVNHTELMKTPVEIDSIKWINGARLLVPWKNQFVLHARTTWASGVLMCGDFWLRGIYFQLRWKSSISGNIFPLNLNTSGRSSLSHWVILNSHFPKIKKQRRIISCLLVPDYRRQIIWNFHSVIYCFIFGLSG